MRNLRLYGLLVLSFLAFPAFAATIGDVAQNLMGPTALVTKLLIVACYIVGMALVFMGLAQYKVHRQSPKLVPLTTPIALVILGTVALFIPYWSGMFETGKTETEVSKSSTLPLPSLSEPSGLSLPSQNKGSEAQSQPQPKRQAPASGSSSGKKRWTDDPRYQ